MPRFTLICSLAALCCSILALTLVTTAPTAAAPETADPWRAERDYPPLIFISQATLDCSIARDFPGFQALETVEGAGFSFTTSMDPITDGTLEVRDPGMRYAFTSFPPDPVPATFSGLGEGTITEMRAEVEVEVDAYLQPGGPGAPISFNAEDIAADSAYVEFTGLFIRARDQKRFPFRVVFGSVPAGNGEVTPADAEPETELMAKSVYLGTPQEPATVITALYEYEEEVRRLE